MWIPHLAEVSSGLANANLEALNENGKLQLTKAKNAADEVTHTAGV